jgi:hypothetical protein
MHVGNQLGILQVRKMHKNSLTQELIPSGKHGATTENTKRYIDFAAKTVLTEF